MQPFLHLDSIVVNAPVQCWSQPDGQVLPVGAQGIHCGDERVVSGLQLSVEGCELAHLATHEPGGNVAEYRSTLRTPDLGVDPQVTLLRRRELSGTSVREQVRLVNGNRQPQSFTVHLDLWPDRTTMEQIKQGADPQPLDPSGFGFSDGAVTWSWRDPGTRCVLTGPWRTEGDHLRASWQVSVPGRGTSEVEWCLEVTDAGLPFQAPTADALTAPAFPSTGSAVEDAAIDKLLVKSISDLNGLRLCDPDHRDQPFFAAGSPWFMTLFGRDSLIAARLLMPEVTSVAETTLRTLARRQGTKVDVDTAEQPGKILHEVRRVTLNLGDADEGTHLPPLYFGTIDATCLWLMTFGDCVRAGMDPRTLETEFRAALGWLRDHADSDGDGFIEYRDESGHGLANQGWKDSGDSVRWRNGDQAEAPIALCEVQGYAHASALVAVEVLTSLGDTDEAKAWQEWAEALKQRFREHFWVSDEHGRYPALALDAHKQAVDAVASNMGHLLGTGILDHDEAEVVVERLMAEDMFSGYGIRTMSTRAGGYWPLGYHVGSVWSHDTAVILDGMIREGFIEQARTLARALLHAGSSFGGRLPELFGGQAADEVDPPVPYPASCRPQAWAAASAVVIARALCRGEAAGA